MSWAGDWTCGACHHLNFKKRDVCQRCGFSKYGGQVDAYNPNVNRTEVLAGDWYCQVMNCRAHNYASRMSCFMCGTQKPGCAIGLYGANNVNDMSSSAGYGSEVNLPGWKSGDWICPSPGCGMHNYACRTECFRCNTPRDFGRTY